MCKKCEERDAELKKVLTAQQKELDTVQAEVDAKLSALGGGDPKEQHFAMVAEANRILRKYEDRAWAIGDPHIEANRKKAIEDFNKSRGEMSLDELLYEIKAVSYLSQGLGLVAQALLAEIPVRIENAFKLAEVASGTPQALVA